MLLHESVCMALALVLLCSNMMVQSTWCGDHLGFLSRRLLHMHVTWIERNKSAGCVVAKFDAFVECLSHVLGRYQRVS